MPHALLLSPDDQAVSAITGVLEEMSVTCERPLDGVSAAQKLNSQSFDLVLVDCENLPAAKLIFDVCRRGKNGNNPVPIAIVDGRAGLPTAFRLGAELILTKPVAKDQARGTIRTAVSRVRKSVQPNESVPAQPASAAATVSATIDSASIDMAAIHTAMTASSPIDTAMTEERTQAAAAGAASSQMTSFADPGPNVMAPNVMTPNVTPKMNSAVEEEEEELHAPPVAVRPQPARPLIPSDDPVLAELERIELEESERTKSQPAESQKAEFHKAEFHKQSSGPAQAAPELGTDKADDPRSSSHRPGTRKTRAPLVALLMLTLAGAGFYAAWTYQPGFQAIVQPQIDRMLALVGMALPAASTPIPAKPSSPTVAAKIPASPIDPNKAAPAAPSSSTSAAGATAIGVSATPAATAMPVQPSAPIRTAIVPPASGAATAPVATAISSDAPLPGENSAIILSSKGAENRLAHSVPPKYPAEAHVEGTVVLKAIVDENGKVDGLRLVEGDATLATAAVQAVKQWRYRPYVRDGKALAFQTVVIVDFQKP